MQCHGNGDFPRNKRRGGSTDPPLYRVRNKGCKSAECSFTKKDDPMRILKIAKKLTARLMSYFIAPLGYEDEGGFHYDTGQGAW